MQFFTPEQRKIIIKNYGMNINALDAFFLLMTQCGCAHTSLYGFIIQNTTI